MIKFIIGLYLLFTVLPVYSQHWEWATYLPLNAPTMQSSIGGVDNLGNCYLTALTSSQDHLNPWSEYQLLKIGPTSGTVWTKNISQYFQGRIITDLNGNNFITCYNKVISVDINGQETLLISSPGQTFGHSILRTDNLIVNGLEAFSDSSKLFFSKYDLTGNLISTYYFRASKFVKGFMDMDGKVITVDGLDPYPHANNKTVLRKLNEDGSLVFMKNVPPSCTPIGDSYSNIYLLGFNGDPSKFSNVPEFQSAGTFLVKYNSAGQLLWSKIIEGSLGLSRVMIDNNENLYYVVDFSAHIKIDEFEINHPTGGLLIIKYDKIGNKVWDHFTPSNNTGPFGYLQPESVFVDQDNELYLSGRISGTLQFGNSLLQTGSDMYTKLFVGKISQKNLVGIQNITSNRAIYQIFPNPSGDIFNLTNSSSDNCTLILTDVRGQLLRTEQLTHQNQYSIDLSAYPKGIYFLQIKSGDKIETKKLVRN